jgi:hypothetical protein
MLLGAIGLNIAMAERIQLSANVTLLVPTVLALSLRVPAGAKVPLGMCLLCSLALCLLTWRGLPIILSI